MKKTRYLCRYSPCSSRESLLPCLPAPEGRWVSFHYLDSVLITSTNPTHWEPKEQAVANQRWYSRIHSAWLRGASIALIVTVAFRVEVWAQATFPTFSTDIVPASGGNIEITPIAHASVQIEYGGMVIHVDPARQGYYANAKLADLILVTDAPGDHLDREAITVIRKVGVPVFVPPSARGIVPNSTVLANGEATTVRGVGIEAVPSYDLKPGGTFHPKGRGNAYVVTLGGARLYFSGGGLECVPELQALTDIDVAFLAMNLPNDRMTPLAAAECVKIFKPKIVYPYHYRDANLEVFRDALEGLPIDVRLADWYPVP